MNFDISTYFAVNAVENEGVGNIESELVLSEASLYCSGRFKIVVTEPSPTISSYLKPPQIIPN